MSLPAARMDRRLVLVLAVASGAVVANSYYAQPLVGRIAADLHASTTAVGLVVTASQVGYAIGLAVLVPLGDLVERRRLLQAVLAGTTLCLVGMALAPAWPFLGVAALLAGVTSVVGHSRSSISVLTDSSMSAQAPLESPNLTRCRVSPSRPTFSPTRSSSRDIRSLVATISLNVSAILPAIPS